VPKLNHNVPVVGAEAHATPSHKATHRKTIYPPILNSGLFLRGVVLSKKITLLENRAVLNLAVQPVKDKERAIPWRSCSVVL
jgi:hypothetical protein